jgi:hypothetical protein
MTIIISLKYFFLDTFCFIVHKRASFIALQALTNPLRKYKKLGGRYVSTIQTSLGEKARS